MSIVPSISGNIVEISPMSFVKINNKVSLKEKINVPDCVEVGDILLIDARMDESNGWKVPGPYNEHAAIYVGNNIFINAGGTDLKVFEANYSFFYKGAKNLAFVRVKSANSTQKQAAVNWTQERIDAPYQIAIEPPWFGLKIANPDFPHLTANKWYCMELVWAAYYNQGIDIDSYGWSHPFGVLPWGPEGGQINIGADNDIEIIYREVNDSTEINKPNKAIYIANKKIISTFNNSIIFGKIDIEIVTLNENITRVDFYINNVYKANDTTAPYSWTWDERVSGKKVIKAVACDNFGNQYSTNITVKKFF